VTNGAIESSTADGLSVTIPYQPPPGNYTVEIDLQLVNVSQQGGSYTLVVPASSTADGYFAGVVNLRPGPRPYADHPTIITMLQPHADQDTTPGGDLPVADFEPKDIVRTYQFQIDGPSVSLSVDGHFFVVAASTKSAPLATGPLKVAVSGAQVRITAIRVYA
jgi:hypothetical protein